MFLQTDSTGIPQHLAAQLLSGDVYVSTDIGPEILSASVTLVPNNTIYETQVSMMTSSNRNTFRVAGPLCGEFTGHRWIPLTKASNAELDVLLDLHLNKRLS